ncbi:MAG: DUF2238 domain-containing protein [Thermodesulfobacteriota bacterium]|nr:DUF2238 domain-containing protein [Thermodesulfobacteriota bacterium]
MKWFWIAIYDGIDLGRSASQRAADLVHCIILMVGGHYTYAEVPLFDWIRDEIGGQRNNFDKLGHFAQGFVPAMIAREILLRKKVVNGQGWRNFFIVCFCLAISAFYGLIGLDRTYHFHFDTGSH